jgi:hypothetical protein
MEGRGACGDDDDEPSLSREEDKEPLVAAPATDMEEDEEGEMMLPVLPSLPGRTVVPAPVAALFDFAAVAAVATGPSAKSLEANL